MNANKYVIWLMMKVELFSRSEIIMLYSDIIIDNRFIIFQHFPH